MTDTQKSLYGALAAFQKDLPKITKGERAIVETKKGGQYSYTYADLSDVSSIVLPKLAAVGIAFVAYTARRDDGGMSLICKLVHYADDKEIKSVFPLRLPEDATPQDLGSAITYGRRYCLVTMTGVAPEDDDDDAAAASQRRTQATQNKATQGAPAQVNPVDQVWQELRSYLPKLSLNENEVPLAYQTWSSGKPINEATVEEAQAFLDFVLKHEKLPGESQEAHAEELPEDNFDTTAGDQGQTSEDDSQDDKHDWEPGATR